MEAWQRENQKLPDDYIHFMNKYNGGLIYPNMFHHNVGDPDD